MSNNEAQVAVEPVSFRQQCKDATQEEFVKGHTKPQLIEIAESVGIESPEGNKTELVEAIYARFPAPDPALRGKSESADPVTAVWELAHNTFVEAQEVTDPEKYVKPRRKDIVAAGQALGIAYYTVRTQYQSWFKYTLGGTNMITADSEGLPKGLKERIFPEEAAS